ncbi:MAG TPA: helix-turn-helix domain-containing protein [Pirellulales bacterium]|nr:helix-turn-helix domain-containing protein [Pirellulales bacterium]
MALPEITAGSRTGLAMVPEVAAHLKVSRSKVYQMMDAGELRFVKLGGSRRVRWEDVDELVRRNTCGAQQ